MATKTWRDANPPAMPEPDGAWIGVLTDVAALQGAVRARQFIHIDQSECISCEGCVDICPWKCLYLVSPDAVESTIGVETPGVDPADASVFVIDDDMCTRCGLCVARCPTGVVTMAPLVESGDEPHARDGRYGFAYGMRW